MVGNLFASGAGPVREEFVPYWGKNKWTIYDKMEEEGKAIAQEKAELYGVTMDRFMEVYKRVYDFTTDEQVYESLLKDEPFTYSMFDDWSVPATTEGGFSVRNFSEGWVLKNGKNNTAVGTAAMTVTGKGKYSGRVEKTFKITPKGTTVSKLTRASKAFKVKWKKQDKEISGYQIQYSAKKNFSSGKKTVTIKGASSTSKTITGLKAKKKYYVRVRTYKEVSKQKFYSS